MAITVEEKKKIQKGKEDAPFTAEELEYISKVEKYIDEEIKKKSDQQEVYIFLYYANFTTDIEKNQRTQYPEYRKTKMEKELIARYKKVGWKISYHYDDGLDGPNMSGADYMIFTPKKRKK